MAYDITSIVGVVDLEDLKETQVAVSNYFNRDDLDTGVKKSAFLILEDIEILEGAEWTDQAIADTCNMFKQKCADFDGVEVEAVHPLGINTALPICGMGDARGEAKSDSIAQRKLKAVIKKWALTEIRYGYTSGMTMWTEVTGLPTEVITGTTTSTDGTTETTGTNSRPANVLDEVAYMIEQTLVANNLAIDGFNLYVSEAKAMQLRTLKQQCCDLAMFVADKNTIVTNQFGLGNIIVIPNAGKPAGLEMALYHKDYEILKVYCDQEPYTEENTGAHVIKKGQWAIKGMETIGHNSLAPEYAFYVSTVARRKAEKELENFATEVGSEEFKIEEKEIETIKNDAEVEALKTVVEALGIKTGATTKKGLEDAIAKYKGEQEQKNEELEKLEDPESLEEPEKLEDPNENK